jgi:hypothetical protein
MKLLMNCLQRCDHDRIEPVGSPINQIFVEDDRQIVVHYIGITTRDLDCHLNTSRHLTGLVEPSYLSIVAHFRFGGQITLRRSSENNLIPTEPLFLVGE